MVTWWLEGQRRIGGGSFPSCERREATVWGAVGAGVPLESDRAEELVEEKGEPGLVMAVCAVLEESRARRLSSEECRGR